MQTKIKGKLLLAAAISLLTLSSGAISVHAETRHYNNGDTVRNLTSVAGGTVNMYAEWDSAEITLPTPVKPGYDFVGWYKDPSCTDFIGNAGDRYTPSRADETLYAKWTAKKYTVSFNTNLEHTETAKYALGTPVGDTSNIEVSFDQPYANLPTITLDGYTFKGWYNNSVGGRKFTNTDKYQNMNAGDGANQTLYAQWINLNPTDVKLYASNGVKNYTVSTTDITTGWSKTPYSLYCTAKDIGDGVASAVIKRADSYSTANVQTLSFNKVKEVTQENGTFNNYVQEGTTSIVLTVTDTEGAKSGRTNTGSTSTKKLNLKVDTKKPVGTMNVTIGSHASPHNTLTNTEWNGWRVYNSEAYGSRVIITLSDKNISAAGGEADVSNIKHAWLVIYDTDNPTTSKSYDLIADNSNELTYSCDTIFDTNNDFNGVMNLTYELHAIDNAGNEMDPIVKTTERKPEIMTKVVRLTEDNSGEPLLFKAGYRGQILVYTTGWVDTLSFEWPEAIVNSGDYDMNHGELGMVYNATIITNGMSNVQTMAETPEALLKEMIIATEYTDYNNPSDKTITLDVAGEHTGFTRCYVFDFWIPVYIGYEENPYHINTNVTNQLTTNITAKKYVINTESEAVTMTETLATVGYFDIKIGNGSIMDQFHTSIVN